MYSIRHNYCTSAILVVSLFFSFTATALNLEPTVGIGMEHTNNAGFTADNEEDDLLAIAFVGARLEAGSGPSYLNATTSLRYQDYTQDTFDSETYFNLNATAGWEMFKDRLDWTVQDFFTQQSINSLDPNTPDNTQDTNVFTLGSNIYFPISVRQSVTLSPEYRKFTYSTQNIDNQNKALNARWNYQIYRTMNVGLSGGVSKVDYDEELITDITFTNIHLTLSGTRPRSVYSADLGVTHVDRENGDSTRGFTGNMSWLFNLTGFSNIRAYVSSDLTDSNNGLLSSSTDPDNGDFSNEQTSSEVFRSSIIRLTYQRNDTSLQSNVWIELRKQDYEQSLLGGQSDRETQQIGMRFNYPVTATVSTGINTDYNRTKLTDDDRKDDRYKIGGNITYRLSRKLRAVADLNYQDRDSTNDIEDYSEMSVFFGIVYGYGETPRANRSGGAL